MTGDELIKSLALLKEHANSTSGTNTFVWDINIDSFNFVIGSAIKALEQELRWIPVTERLPENDGYYLVTEKSGRVCIYVFHKEGNSEEYWERCTLAWMPLPQSYREIKQDPVLDKIRAEIKSLERFEIRGEVTPLVNVDSVLEIIDKAETEAEE